MSALLVLVIVVAYALAAYLLWRERSLRCLLVLLAGHLAMLLVPLWQRLYGITPMSGSALSLLGRFEIPWPLLIGGGPLLALPALLFYYGVRHRWWPRHYAAVWAGYAVFVLYFLMVAVLLERNGTIMFSEALVVGERQIPSKLVQAVLIGGISLGMGYTLISTRHYALQVALLPLLLSGIVSALLFMGVFASPLWVSTLLRQDGLLVVGAALVSLALVLWGVHLLAQGLHLGRTQQFVWR